MIDQKQRWIQNSSTGVRPLSSAHFNKSGWMIGFGSLAIAGPALAHHPLGGRTPNTFLEGFLSGLGHPILGLDHFAFVIALGFLAALVYPSFKKALFLPLSFTLASLLGVGLHLMALNVPGSESIVASTVAIIGLGLFFNDRVPSVSTLVFGAIAGIFHGYAYGEAIIGSEMSPVVAYLLGLMLIQTAIAIGIFSIVKVAQSFMGENLNAATRPFGILIGTLGLVLLGNTLLG